MSGRLKTQRTGSAVFGEKRQKPGRRQQDSQTQLFTILYISVKEVTAFTIQ